MKKLIILFLLLFSFSVISSEKENILFENDIYKAIDVHTCVDKRNTIGAPGPKAMEQVIAINKKWIEEHEG